MYAESRGDSGGKERIWTEDNERTALSYFPLF